MHSFTAVISEKAEKAINALQRDFDVLALPPDVSLDGPVSCHTDMILFTLGKKAVVHSTYDEQYPSICGRLRSAMGYEVMLDFGERKREYPFDVGLNVLTCGNTAFSLVSHTSDTVRSILLENGIKHVNVKQGYAACSTLSLGSGVITADKGIAAAAEREGIRTLMISGGCVSLDGYNEGFIGGASGVCGERVYFLGNIDSHPDSKNIRSFAESLGYECVSLYDGDLYDFGGIRFLPNLL